jgi:hypothetical protein
MRMAFLGKAGLNLEQALYSFHERAALSSAAAPKSKGRDGARPLRVAGSPIIEGVFAEKERRPD